jgi:hypothetical protein
MSAVKDGQTAGTVMAPELHLTLDQRAACVALLMREARKERASYLADLIKRACSRLESLFAIVCAMLAEAYQGGQSASAPKQRAPS